MRSIEYYFACTNDKVINYFDGTNKFKSFLDSGKLLHEGNYTELKIENCDFYFIDDNCIFAINNDSKFTLTLIQYNNYTYCFTSPIFGKKRKLIHNKEQTASFLITLFDSNSSILEIPNIKEASLNYVDYYNKNLISNSFFPINFCKKISFLNLAIDSVKGNKIIILDSKNSFDLKFLSEALLLEENCLLVPNILHMNNELLPFSFSKTLFKNINMFNDNAFSKKIIYYAIINSFLKGFFIKTYPAVISGKRIRGDFDNVSEKEKNEILKEFSENFILKQDDIKIYETALISDSFLGLR